jgi:hypothetical protein
MHEKRNTIPSNNYVNITKNKLDLGLGWTKGK